MSQTAPIDDHSFFNQVISNRQKIQTAILDISSKQEQLKKISDQSTAQAQRLLTQIEQKTDAKNTATMELKKLINKAIDNHSWINEQAHLEDILTSNGRPNR